MSFKLVNETIELKKEAGLEGIILTIRSLFKKPRIQSVHIDGKGTVSFSYYKKEEEPDFALNVDFESVSPWALVRNSDVMELLCEYGENAGVVLSRLFHEVHRDQLFPIGFIMGEPTIFIDWLQKSLGFRVTSSVFGTPFFFDTNIPDDVVLLSASFTPSTALMDTAKCYKLTIPKASIRLGEALEPIPPEANAIEVF